jgi:crossover junction endodeoxyribonuclease RuvC
MIVLGIDPGAVSAAWAAITDTHVNCGDVPVADRMVDANGFANLVSAMVEAPTGLGAIVAVIEKVNAFPAQGVSSSFRFGMGYGIIHGVLAALAVQRVDVAPGLWKRHFRLGPDKEQARALALRRFPMLALPLGRKRDAGRAEAVLMALWWQEQGAGL